MTHCNPRSKRYKKLNNDILEYITENSPCFAHDVSYYLNNHGYSGWLTPNSVSNRLRSMVANGLVTTREVSGRHLYSIAVVE